MQKTIYQRLNAVLWTLIVCFVVLLAIYVSVGRMLVSNMGAYRGDILQEINARVPFIVEADGVAGEWQSFTPIIVLSGLKLSVPPGDQPPLTLSEGRIAVDVFESLRTRSLQMARIELENLALRGELTEEGRFRLEGLGAGGEIGDWLRDFILNVELVSLRENTLSLGLPGGERRQLDLSLRLERDGSLRRLEVGLESSRGARITVLGEGVGDPFSPELFTGDLYTRITTDDLGAVRQMLSDRLTGTWAEGSVDMELWLAFERGETELQGRLNASDLLIANEDRGWQIPLQKLALEAELFQGRDRWTLFGTGLEVQQEGVAISVPRLQLDGWGQALRLRAADVPLGSLADLVSDLPSVPGKLAEAMRILDPAGNLSTLQVSVGDIRSPQNDWEIEARFSDMRVTSWRGAPGVSSATGYLEVFPGHGQVLLDSSNLVLEFPVIYRAPLEYKDFHGALHIGWDSERLRITSDLIVAAGDEGTGKALFGLDVPFTASDEGMDMSLLVGLENSHPMHRVKYVPDNLNQTLRDWLGTSVGDGFVQQGAFLWRGSLRKGAAARRTVQLAFNVTDTFVDYHPRWPAVEVVSGVILVDDSEVSVWASEALFRDSTVKRLSVETWLEKEGQLMLAVDGRMQGPAADGLAVINASPIDGIVNGAFREWAMQGGLEVDLNFQLNLSDRTVPPRVDVDTRWQEVDIDILPGDVSLRDIKGSFSYDSAKGFRTADLGGTLWGKPFSLEVLHPGLDTDRDFDPATSATEVLAVTRVDLADVRRWLKFESLAFAQGVAAAEVRLQVEPGQAPLLQVDSALEGVSLDFPTPWRKEAGEKRPLRVSLALGEQGGPLEFMLGDDLSMHLDLRGRRMNSAALGIGGPPGELVANSLCVTGRAPLIHGDEWSQFIRTYFGAGWATALDREIPDPNSPADDQVTPGMAIAIDDLRADSLEIWGQTFPDVTFSLNVNAGRWHLSGASDWLQGEYLQEPGREYGSLSLQRLDLLGASNMGSDPGGEQRSPVEVPAMTVAIERLHRGDQELGNLAFNLRSEGPALIATDLSGEIAGLKLGQPEAGQLTWHQEAPGSSSLQLDVGFDDLGDTLAQLGYERIVETRGGNFSFDLTWPGAPQAFSLEQGEGAVSVAIKQGSFLEAPSGASGALKVVNILNLADIVQRLSLSHMFESGIPFDSVEGEIFLHGGTIEVAGMEVKGPSSFYFSGVAGVEQRSLDGELVATLPVADNLPWVAALAAGLPVAAGVYVVSKLLQKQVDQLSSAVYSIRGSWDEPQVEFAHIFDSGGDREGGQVQAAVEAATESEAEGTGEVANPLPDQSGP